MHPLELTEIGRLFYIQVEKIIQEEKTSGTEEKLHRLFKLCTQLYQYATKDDKIQFSDFSTRISFIGHKFNIPKRDLFPTFYFRKQYFKMDKAETNLEELLDIGILALVKNIEYITQNPATDILRERIKGVNIHFKNERNTIAFYKIIRVLLIEDDKENFTLMGIREENPTEQIKIRYNVTGRNDFFNPTIKCIRNIIGFPLVVNLLDVEIDEDGVYFPKGFVILPDYLVDITSISNCFLPYDVDPKLYLLKKFIPLNSNPHLMIGNVANYFLDEIMSSTDSNFQELITDMFHQYPISFSAMDDREVREIFQKSQKHYLNLIDTIKNEFQQQNIVKENSYLEPSFYSRDYGIQGRLDLWYNDNEGNAAIVELKSGKPFMPNRQGLSRTHYVQTLLYDLLVKSVYGNKINPTNFILYSQMETNRLRFAEVSNPHQMEAMQVRNHILSIEFLLSKMSAENHMPLHWLNSERIKNWKGFNARDLQTFEKVTSSLSPLEQKYFSTLTGFIAREHFTAKIGSTQGLESRGQSLLWSKLLKEKEDDFEILSHLSPISVPEKNGEPIFIFKKTNQTNPLANFRVGDVCVLYPNTENTSTVLDHRIFKCSIIELNPTEVHVRLRAKQHHLEIFSPDSSWHLEHDLFDSSFNGQYKELFYFAEADKYKRDLLLTLRPPNLQEEKEIIPPAEMTDEQKGIFKNIVNQGELFLLWGPPGTGKTNMMLKHLVGYLIKNSEENILLLTYTNRAADEICSAIESYSPEIRNQYYRVGSRFSTSEKYRDRLLNNIIAKAKNRKEVSQLIQQHRIVIATVSSMIGKRDLFLLKTFHRVIIDESSQITETMLCGLLPKFPKVLMIGDHKQLPAVVTQNLEGCNVKDEDLNQIGLFDLRTSLFERLYHRYQEENWNFALGQLTHQGRMHEDIMTFSNERFYEGNLKILPPEIADFQSVPLEFKALKTRIRFISAISETEQINDKTAPAEAETICNTIHEFQEIMGEKFDISQVGIITPFRAQIACIRNCLEKHNIPTERLTIDTVERYQGGARDIIIISTAVNHPLQLQTIISSNGRDSIDRKLNVALTRARKHLVVIGNKEVLRLDENYGDFIKRYECLMFNV